LLADESCPWPVVAAVRKAGFDVASIGEDARGAPDEEVLRNSLPPGRVVLTQDRDFGERGQGKRGDLRHRLDRHPNSPHLSFTRPSPLEPARAP